MLYLAALGMVLFVAAGTALLVYTLVIRPERRRHGAEVATLRKRLVAVAAEQLRVRSGGSVRHAARFPTVKA